MNFFANLRNFLALEPEKLRKFRTFKAQSVKTMFGVLVVFIRVKLFRQVKQFAVNGTKALDETLATCTQLKWLWTRSV